jgi:hypothetical protein
MAEPIKILLQTTIPPTQDDWHIGRFAMLRDYLAGLQGADGTPLTVVETRDRAPPGGPDPVLCELDKSDYDELWLFAVDTGDGLTQEDCAGISRFRKRGGGMMVTRDHIMPTTILTILAFSGRTTIQAPTVTISRSRLPANRTCSCRIPPRPTA